MVEVDKLVSRWPPDWQEEWQERVAIMQHDGKMTETDAKLNAFYCVGVRREEMR